LALLSKPPPFIRLKAQRAARSRTSLFVRAGATARKRASAHKALMRMSSVALTWGAAKQPMRAHPFLPQLDRNIYVIRDAIVAERKK